MTDRPGSDKGDNPAPHAGRGWLYRFRGVVVADPAPSAGSIFIGTVGAGLAVAVIGLIGSLAGELLLIAPLGATSLLLFAVPESVMSQPRNVIVGHLIASALGIGLAHLIGPGWGAAALATGLAVGLMQLVRALHAPAGATAVFSALQAHDWTYIGLPVLAGAAVVLAAALIVNNLVPGRRYPVRWF